MKCKIEGCTLEFKSVSTGLRKKAGVCNRHRWLKYKLGYYPNLAEYDKRAADQLAAWHQERLLRGLLPGQSVDANGYVRNSATNKYVHREIMEQELERALLPDESVHHKDGNKINNKLENLELWSKYQPAGQRVSDKLVWAQEIIRRYDQAMAVT